MYKRQVKVSIECLTYSIISIIYIKKDSWLLKKKKKTVDVLVFYKTIQAWRQNLLNSSFLEKKLVFLVFSSSILEVLTSYFNILLPTCFTEFTVLLLISSVSYKKVGALLVFLLSIVRVSCFIFSLFCCPHVFLFFFPLKLQRYS